MKNVELQCLRCERPMQAGFLADNADAGILVQSKWVEGLPVSSKFLGMKTGSLAIKDRQTFALSAYRCPECFHIEIFAIPEDNERDILLRPAGKGEKQETDELLRGSDAPKREE